MPKWVIIAILIFFGAVGFRFIGITIPPAIVALLIAFAPIINELVIKRSKKSDVDTKNIDKKEAMEILGLSENPSEEEIKEAYHRLMKKNHPDQDGSKYIAAKLNQAKEILLKNKH